MLSSAIIISFLLPMQISCTSPRFELFIVQATIDAAVIAGLPASKAAKKYVLQAQKPDFLMTEAHLASDPVGWRRLYFRKLFS
jgi:hypothetical protein